MADHQLKIQIRNNYIQLNSNLTNKVQLTHLPAVTMVIHNNQLRNSLMDLHHFNSQLCKCLRPQLYLIKCHKVNNQLPLVLNKMALITNLNSNPSHNNNTSANPNKQLVTAKRNNLNNKMSTLIRTKPLNNKISNSHNTNSHNSNSCRNSSSNHNSNNSLRQSLIQTSNPIKIVILIKSLNL